MKKTRFLALLLALLMVALPLVSCKKDPEPEPEPTPDPATPEVKLDLVTEGVANYVIVRDYKADGAVLDAVASLVTAIKTFIGADVEVKECYNDREEENEEESEYEILVGMTNREESIQALKGKRSNDWVMGVYGSKLVLGSTSDSGTLKAVTRFLNNFVYEQGNRYSVADYVSSNGLKGELMSLVFSDRENVAEYGTYSYDLFEIFSARIDSFTVIRAKDCKYPDKVDSLAENLVNYISNETGYVLENKKDTRCYADYEILVGQTIRTPDGLEEQLAPDEYYIKLVETANGAQMYILFGENAQSAAYQAFCNNFMPGSKTPVQKSVTDGFVLTNSKLS